MKNYKQILEAINRGIQLALDDFDDEDQVQNIKSKQVQNRDYTKEYLDLMNDVVDLGLPSGTLWCKYNLGVNPNQLLIPEDWYGDCYAWGEIEPNKTDKDGTIYFDWSNYKYGNLSNKLTKYRLTKYCSDPDSGLKHYTDNLTQILPEDDAAYQNKKLHNFKFHIPTKEQCEELIKYTNSYWVNNYNPNKLEHNPENDKGIYDLNGTLFISKINNAKLFIPDANYYDNENYGHNKEPYIGKKRYDSAFWTAYPNLSNYNQAWAYIFIVEDNILYGWPQTKNRWAGLPIRPVTIYKNL